MRHYSFVLLLLILIASCRKHDTNSINKDYLQHVKSALKDSLSVSEFNSLDFSKTVLSKVDSIQLYLVRIPYKNNSLATKFVIVKTSSRGDLQQGRIVHLEGQITEEGNATVKRKKWNGHLSVTLLNGKNVLNSPIADGFIKSLHTSNQKEAPVYPDPYIELPEVIVVSSYSSGGGISWSTWISLLSFFNNNDYGSSGGYYGNTDPFSGGGGGGGYSSGGSSGDGNSGPHNDPPIYIDFENQFADPAIEIEKYMKCFNDIPDDGATGSIEIFTDIPVNDDPTKLFDWKEGSPGHTFIQLRKNNGSQSVSQNIGFYPKTHWKSALTPAPVDGKFVDNHEHEFNASLKINLTSAQVQTAVTRILYLARFVKYDIDDYNCTDWALDVFNEAVKVQERLEIPKYDIPGGMAPYGSSTPQGLYIKLQEMQSAGGAQAGNITIPLIGWIGQSSGPCN